MIILMRTLLLSRQKLWARVVSNLCTGTCSNKFNRARESKGWLVESYFRELSKHLLQFWDSFIHSYFFSSKCKVNLLNLLITGHEKNKLHVYLWWNTSTSTCSTRNDWVPKLKLPIIPSVNSFDMAPTTEVMRFYLFRFFGFSRVCKFIFIGFAFKSSLHTNTTAFWLFCFKYFLYMMRKSTRMPVVMQALMCNKYD